MLEHFRLMSESSPPEPESTPKAPAIRMAAPAAGPRPVSLRPGAPYPTGAPRPALRPLPVSAVATARPETSRPVITVAAAAPNVPVAWVVAEAIAAAAAVTAAVLLFLKL